MPWITCAARAGLARDRARIEARGGGVSNAVFRVLTPERMFVLKQSQPQLRTRAAWFSDLDRVYREQEVMEALHALLPEPTVPALLFQRPGQLRVRHEPCPGGLPRTGKKPCLPARRMPQ